MENKETYCECGGSIILDHCNQCTKYFGKDKDKKHKMTTNSQKDRKGYGYTMPVCEDCDFCMPNRGHFGCQIIPVGNEEPVISEETRPTGEKEIWKEKLEYFMQYDEGGMYDEAVAYFEELVSQARKEGAFTKKELSYLSWAMNAERFGEDMIGKRPKTSAEEHDILNSKINSLVG